MTTIHTSKSEILKALNFLKIVVKDTVKKNYKIMTFCEVTVTDMKVVFSVPGSQYTIACTTTGTAKFSSNFLYFYDVIRNYNGEEMHIEIDHDEVNIGSLRFFVKTCFFKDDSILRTINLPAEYLDKHILNLIPQGYTQEEIEFNNLQNKLILAEKKLHKKMKQAFCLLKEYNVTLEDVELLTNRKLFKK